MIYAALYTYDQTRDDIGELRPAHRAHLKDLYDQGSLLASGPRGDGALLLLTADSEEGARALLENDPFIVSGIVIDVDLAPWTVVYGPWS